ncbi:MAG: diaminopimelate decarboxylase [Lachnospiraceae bacterium]|nr:diaminopimelate decarboxylase [Lachnospiraceae bacterium]
MRSFVADSHFFAGVDPEELTKRFGTPLYVYNEAILRDRMRAVAGMITKYPYTANYSMKANSNTAILKIAKEEGLNADAMSEGEIRLLERVNFPYERIFFVPNNVSDEEMRYAVERGIMVSLDSLDQLSRYGELFPGTQCSVRINPGVGAGHHEKVITAGKHTKFAVSMDEIEGVHEIAKQHNLKIVGLNQHVGSLFMEIDPYVQAVKNLLHVALDFPGLKLIDFGGGLGTPYHKLDGEAAFPIGDLHDALEPVLDDFVEKYGSAPLFKSEPGRYCVAEGSVILGRAYARKSNAGVKYLGTDIGMNVLARPSLYDAWHDIEILRDGKPVTEGQTEEITVAGNICESGDVLARERTLPVSRDGDLVCVLDTGAYGYSMSYTYNTRPRPAEVMITPDGNYRLIRRRESFEDLMSLLCE